MSNISKKVWGASPSGEEIELYTLRNANGVEATITNFGGRIVTLKTPDAKGHFADITLGFDHLDSYLASNPYFGALVGRYANRIANGRFQIDGQTYTLLQNNGQNALHGGAVGFDSVAWKAHSGASDTVATLTLQYLSKDGEEGFPGNLNATVVYTLGSDNSLSIEYRAATDKPTVVNLTNHAYFNLAGHTHGDVLDHDVFINASHYTPVNSNLIPTGERRPVAGTAVDFQVPHRVGDRIDSQEEQMLFGHGYDHNFVVNGSGLRLAARASHHHSGRVMEVYGTQPGIQFYTGNFLPEKIHGKYGAVYGRRSGFCFETQHFPDSPNQPSFPSALLRPGAEYHQTVVFKFSVK